MMKTTKKILYYLFVVMIVALPLFTFLLPSSVAAVTTEYTPLEPIPPLSSPGATTINISSYIPSLVKLAIQIAGALAVIMIVIGGVQYVSTDAISGKSEGKEKIKNALYGLLLAIGAYVILYSVNPDVLSLKLNLTLSPIAVTPVATTTINTGGTLAGRPWPSGWPGWSSSYQTDAQVRNTFTALGNVTINRTSDCTTIGQQACTSLDGLSASAISGITALSQAARIGGISIMITGGTEYWLHKVPANVVDPTDPLANGTQHRPGGGAVDLSKNSGLDGLIMGPGQANLISNATGCSSGPHYRFNGTVYVDEQITGVPAHWHVCY